ncbi:MAG: hypothetical protein ACRDU4_22820 [Mycobacterium sp.]
MLSRVLVRAAGKAPHAVLQVVEARGVMVRVAAARTSLTFSGLKRSNPDQRRLLWPTVSLIP